MTPAELEAIRAHAERFITVIAEHVGQTLAYDRAGVEWVDGYVQRQHEQGDPKIREGLAKTVACYLGECLIRGVGGEWAMVGGMWAIRFDERNAAYPLNKVQKHLENGAEDSILSFYDTIATLVAQGVFPKRV